MDEEKSLQNEEKVENSEKVEETVDHFSMFMFGTNHQRKTTIDIDKDSIHSSKRVRGDQWILGGKKEELSEETEIPNALENFINQIDLELLMKNIDLFMASTKDLKPILKKVSPFIKKWMD